MVKQENKPLELINYYTQKYPSCWGLIEKIREQKGNGIPSFPDWCYIPTSYINPLLDAYNKSSNKALNHDDNYILAALAAWRQAKEIYLFNNELAQDLTNEAKKLLYYQFPSDILLDLPFRCIYIETEDGKKSFFVNLDYVPSSKAVRLNITHSTSDSGLWLNSEVEISSDMTIAQQVSQGVDRLYGQVKQKDVIKGLYTRAFGHSSPVPVTKAKLVKALSTQLAEAVQLILYLCSNQPDIRQNSKPVKRSNVIHDKYREIRQWDVGVRYGTTIRELEKEAKEAEVESESEDEKQESKKTSSYSRKRPHIRRGHYHHYWTGPRNNPDKRKLVLVWLDPVLVNTDTSEKLPTVIHKVK